MLETALTENEQLRAQLSALQAEFEALKAENLELRAKLETNSSNSSKPPSSDMSSAKPPKKKRSKGKRRGAKKGHQAHFAPTPDHVDHVVDVRPDTCSHCSHSLDDGLPTGTVVSHFTYELPPIEPIVSEHRCFDVICPDCQKVTSAQLPPEVPRGRFGASVVAMVGFFRGELRQSVRQTAAVMTRLFQGS